MKVLAIETATVRQSVAVVQDAQVLASASHEEPGSHSRWLLPTIDRVLQMAGCTVRDVDALVVSHGPGSFTGLRVGLATALGLRAVTGRPIVVVGTLEAMAWGVRGQSGPLCPILPCRKGEVFWAQYEWMPDGRLKTLCEPHVGPPEAIPASVRRPTAVLGEGWALVQEIVAPDLSLRTREWREVPPECRHPSAMTLAQAGMEQLRRGHVAEAAIVPLYVQRAEAELKRGLVEGKSARIIRGGGRAVPPKQRGAAS